MPPSNKKRQKKLSNPFHRSIPKRVELGTKYFGILALPHRLNKKDAQLMRPIKIGDKGLSGFENATTRCFNDPNVPPSSMFDPSFGFSTADSDRARGNDNFGSNEQVVGSTYEEGPNWVESCFKREAMMDTDDPSIQRQLVADYLESLMAPVAPGNSLPAVLPNANNAGGNGGVVNDAATNNNTVTDGTGLVNAGAVHHSAGQPDSTTPATPPPTPFHSFQSTFSNAALQAVNTNAASHVLPEAPSVTFTLTLRPGTGSQWPSGDQTFPTTATKTASNQQRQYLSPDSDDVTASKRSSFH